MSTVATPAPKSNKAFYAMVSGQPGTLVQGADGRLYFLTAADLVVFTPAMALDACVLGEVGLSDAQAAFDKMHGGYAAIACSREQGRA